MRPRIAHGLFTWRDGRTALEACLRSTAPYVDELIIADGLIQGVDPGGLPAFSDLSWLAEADYLPARVPISTKEWRSLSAACTWILHQAKALDCDWLLYVDGDQELHNGAELRSWIAGWSKSTTPAVPIFRADNGRRRPVPWQLVRVAAIERYLAGCFVVELTGGPGPLGPGALSLVPLDGRELPDPQGAPWLSHHPERRPPERYPHRLGELETVLEPPPLGTPSLQLAGVLAYSPAMTEKQNKDAPYYCDQCGTRYEAAGICSNNHPPAEVVKTSGKAKADAGDDTGDDAAA
jgi:hypothetical protein